MANMHVVEEHIGHGGRKNILVFRAGDNHGKKIVFQFSPKVQFSASISSPLKNILGHAVTFCHKSQTKKNMGYGA